MPSITAAGGAAPAGHHLDRRRERASEPRPRIEQHVHHDRRAAEMGDAVARDRVVDRCRLDPAQADMGTGERGDGPRKAPAVAVKHRQGPQIDRVLPHAPDQDVAERVQVGAAMVIDDAFRVAGGARGVVERDRVPIRRPASLPGIQGHRREKGLVIQLAEPLAARSLRDRRCRSRPALRRAAPTPL